MTGVCLARLSALQPSRLRCSKIALDASSHASHVFWVQVVLCVDSMYWTHDVGAAIVRGTLEPTAKRLSTELMQASACDTSMWRLKYRWSMLADLRVDPQQKRQWCQHAHLCGVR